MKKINKSIFSVTYTDGSVSEKELGINFNFNDGKLDVSMIFEIFGDYSELSYKISGVSNDASVKYIDTVFLFSPDFLNEELVYFYNGWLTNDWVESRKYIGNTGIIGRDVTVMKNIAANNFFHVGYITANRFWTYIKFEQDRVIFRHFMEDKVIPVGKSFLLERLLISDSVNEYDYLEHYGDRIAEIYNIKLEKPMPTGWCSWSCFYKNINRENVIDAVDGLFNNSAKMNLLQLDDGWQDESEKHSAEWMEDTDKFPDGMRDFANYLNKQGINLGLWLAPTLPYRNSKFIDNIKDELWIPSADTAPEVLEKAKNIPPRYDIGKPEVIERFKKIFERLAKVSGVSYFKLDFLFDTFGIDIKNEQFVTFEADYMVALYRNMLMAIREAVGEESFMLACGAPILECAGIFDGSRIAPDIVWPKGVGKYSSWTIVKKCIINVMLRYFYHDKVFYNDADGVVLRDYDIGDGFDNSYHEVRAWATVVAMSGGVTLQNDINRMLSPARRKLFFELFPLNRIAAKPVDFFELPYPSQLYIDYPSAKLLSVFNLDEGRKEYSLSLSRLGLSGKYIIVNAWEKRVLGIFENEYIEPCFLPHSAEVYLIKKVPDTPEFIYMDNNLFLGADMVSSVYENGKLTLTLDEKAFECDNKNAFLFVPNGYECAGDIVAEYEQGKIYKSNKPLEIGENIIEIIKT